ncbi:MFS transporter [Alicyclobacillaceae bacterium I2511]|nr:MFS transporter [Alicyclobacillaceae bacterium I2511]
MGWNLGAIIGILLGGLVWAEKAQASPALNLSLFRIPSLSFSLLASFFQSLGNFAVLFLLMMYLQGVRGLSPLQASLLLVPGYIVGSAMGPLSGRLTDRIGAIVPATGGLVAQMMAILLYAQLGTSTALGWVTVGSLINGVGSGLFFPANNAAVMKAAPSGVYGIVSGMLRTFANIGMVMSFAVAMFIAAQSIPQRLVDAIFVGTATLTPHLTHNFDIGIHNAFYGSIVMMILAAASSSLRGRHKVRSSP